ncbi:hypothetical protein [Psychroserpens jangbogonensis]|uniref:hypothetical protein n=1 Tax=Psychroserpens jangbogonensis TaxID=1484460 RepID=UPI00053F2160|nr:hypothetical protein [Psychroserpens jangbogonensis]
MKKLIYLLCILGFNFGFTQEFKTVSLSELNFEVNNDTTEIKAKISDKYLNGKYKIILNLKKDNYSMCDFQYGEIIGIQKSYQNGILTGTTEFKNGKQNGYDIYYNQTGEKIIWKVLYVDGKKHGLGWWFDIGNQYYINGKKATQEEFEQYDKNNKR